MAARAERFLLGGLVCVAAAVVIVGLALGIGWMEAFGAWPSLWLMLMLLGGGVAWGWRHSRRLLPVAGGASARRTLNLMQGLWSAQVIAVGLYGVAAHWWINRTLASTRDRWVLLPWAMGLLVAIGAGLLAFGWVYGRRALSLERILDRDVAVQRRRVQTGVCVVWSAFEAAGCLGMIVACGTLSWWPYDLLGGGAIASLFVHQLVWCERLVDAVMHPPLVEPEDADA